MTTFNIFFLLVSLSLIIAVLLQQRGAGLGEAFGGTGGVYASRRGAEKALYNLTIWLSIIFVLMGGISVYQRRVQTIQPSSQDIQQAQTVVDTNADQTTSDSTQQ